MNKESEGIVAIIYRENDPGVIQKHDGKLFPLFLFIFRCAFHTKLVQFGYIHSIGYCSIIYYNFHTKINCPNKD